MNLNRTSLLHSTNQSPFQNKRSRQLLLCDDTLNLSPILNDMSFRTLNDTSLRQALEESSIIGALPNSAGDGLNEAFFEIIQTSHRSEILNTLTRLHEACTDSFERIDPWKRYNAENYWLAEEANSWKLLYHLYEDTIKDHPSDMDSISADTLSQQDLVTLFLQSNAEVRLLVLLANWLETCAAYQEGSTKTNAPIIVNLHWSNTLHQLVIGTSLFNKEKNKAMVTCLDPDAPKRQRKSIHSDDQQEDDNVCKRIFTEIRCGKFENAIEVCVNAGQPWRAAVLQGSRLLHYISEVHTGSLQMVGNASRDLWKWCCIGIINDISENLYYRATLGILCGHLPSTLAACHGNWKDLLWAHLKVQIETRIHKFLHEHHVTANANTTLPEVLEMLESVLQNEEISLEKIFNSVNALMDGIKESEYQKCQRNLMLGDIRNIMEESLENIDVVDENLVRFLAHLVLILRQMGKDPKHEIGDQILEKYVIQLIEKLAIGSIECPKLVAYYTSTVPTESQIKLYAELMDCIDKSETRKNVVEAGVIAGIDVAAAARVAIKKAITSIHQNYVNINMSVTQIEKDKPLVEKILSSLEWLAFIPNQLEDALWLSNAMIRTFIFMGNCEAATSILISINELFPDFMKKVSTKSSELREHLSLKAYLDALEHFGIWHRHFNSEQPKEVSALPADASFSDKVVHEQRVAQFEQQQIRWKKAVLNMSTQTKTYLYNILLFPGGWLLDENDSTSSPNFTEAEKIERAKQLDTLRRLYIPEVVILILKVLQSNDDIESHKEALQLSNIIAAENRCLYKVFAKDKLAEILDRIKASSFSLLEKGKDMFGYDIEEDIDFI